MELTQAAMYPVTATAIALMVFGVILNSAIVVALTRKAIRRSPSTWFALNMFVTDIIHCAVYIPLSKARLIDESWIQIGFVCHFLAVWFYAYFGVSLGFMTLVAVNRYNLHNNRIKYNTMYTCRNVIIMIAFMWISSLGGLALPILGYWGSIGVDNATASCNILQNDGGSSPKTMFLVSGTLPHVVINIVCFGAILKQVMQSRRAIRNGRTYFTTPLEPTIPTQVNDLKLTKTMAFVFTSFVICILPMWVVNYMETKISEPWEVFVALLAWTAGVVKPLIYLLTCDSYREAFVALFGQRRRQRYTQAATSSTTEGPPSQQVATVIFSKNAPTTTEGPTSEEVATIIFSKYEPTNTDDDDD